MAVIPSIPASQIVDINPSVLAAGGSGLDLVGLVLTQNNKIPTGQVLNFPTAASIAAYFGSNAIESAYGSIYFLGNDNSFVKPGSLSFVNYNTASISAFLRSGAITLTLTQLQTVSGTINCTIDGSLHTGTLNMAGATSFSNAAQILGTALALGTVGAMYDSILGTFVIMSQTTGTGSTISYGSGSVATQLNLTQALGAVISQGAAANTPGTGAPLAFMNNLITQTQNWATFTTTFEPTDADKISFAQWNNGQNNRYLYAMWETNVLDTEAGGPSVPVSTITAGNYSGIAMLYSNPAVDTIGGEIAAFLMGQIASIDFDEHNGRTTSAFTKQTGLPPQVTNVTINSYLLQYGLSFYGTWTTANAAFTFLYPGSVSGPFLWIDSYVNQIWLNSQLQVALLNLLTNVKSLPYNTVGFGLVRAAMLDPILAAVNFGAIVPGVTLSQAEIAEVNTQAGVAIDSTLTQQGWYLQVLAPPATVRQSRGSPVVTLWYADGESIQKISVSSVDVL